uniref:hypothetical protein n=1 Tax=Pseudonocardia sp. CA-138482 TaxID=3240023 RepID=UPI003F496783
MMEPISMLVGAGLLLAGWAVGRVSRRRPKSPAPICSCGHGYGMHEQGGGRCRDEKRRYVRCNCQVYDGPEPLPRAWMPPAIP